MKRATFLGLGALTVALAAGCGAPQPTYVRGSDVPGIDDPAMGTGLDRRDLETLLEENMAHMTQSPFYEDIGRRTSDQPTVAILPMENWTTEHIEPQLHALLGMVETQLVNSGRFTVVASSLRDQILDELHLQQGEEFDQGRAVQLGRQLGVHYFVTGRVVDNTERTASARRVQYFMFMQAISVETGAIVWQNQAELTKAIIPL
ncbi:MAG: penicillin-binding protein activator LpoB [Myxococcales bacterium]|nr:penicillin-binding protein activator LpoB [Myxococcales bacterium]MCB9521281.1 penicillin-binding protein activator LpoB [Myxococcales bacterium]